MNARHPGSAGLPESPRDRWVAYAWAAPWTLLGIAIGGIGWATGGSCRPIQGVLEFQGGWLSWLLRKVPIEGGAAAVTLGHAVVGRSREDLERSREHERIHVRQYERWGPLFVPIYLAASLLVWCRGCDPYRDNPFEREAYDADSCRTTPEITCQRSQIHNLKRPLP